VRVATFNINNINKRLDNLLAWLGRAEPDVVSLQELKAEQRLARRGKVPGVQIGKLWRFRRSELNAWIEKMIARG
jgi:exodeoxyribonuclease-3